MLVKKSICGTIGKYLLVLCLLFTNQLAALAWKELNNGTASCPSPRAFSSMTFDASIMQLVLFGGAGNLVGEFFGDTWLWTGSQPTGSTWLPVTTTSITNPAPRSGASMAFDEITQKPLLFGGAAGLQTFNDIWTLGQLPQILSLTPNNGSLDGGTEVTIIGLGFTGVIAVNFGANPAINFTLVSSTAIQALSPPLSLPATSATVDVTVTTTIGTSLITAVDQFTYTGVFPPTQLGGSQKANKFETQTDLVNIITWKAPLLGEAPVVYKIYRDQNLKNLIAEIPSDNRLRFIDHNRKKGKRYSYFIVSVSDDGDISSPAKFKVEGCSRS
jgi:hypothetical protein